MAWYKAGGGSKPKQSKTVTPSTGVQEITADSGKELEKVTVNAMPSGALKTPTINASGLVTSGVQTSGYLPNSAESTLQLSTQGARTFTPTITNTTLVNSGKYTTGAIICKGDANLKAENIAKGKSIFGVNGSYEQSLTELVSGNIKTGQTAFENITKNNFVTLNESGFNRTNYGEITGTNALNEPNGQSLYLGGGIYMMFRDAYGLPFKIDENGNVTFGTKTYITTANYYGSTCKDDYPRQGFRSCFAIPTTSNYTTMYFCYIEVNESTLEVTINKSYMSDFDQDYCGNGHIRLLSQNRIFFFNGRCRFGIIDYDRSSYTYTKVSDLSIGSSEFEDCHFLDANTFVGAYTEGSGRYWDIRMGKISGTTITLGTALRINSTSSSSARALHMLITFDSTNTIVGTITPYTNGSNLRVSTYSLDFSTLTPTLTNKSETTPGYGASAMEGKSIIRGNKNYRICWGLNNGSYTKEYANSYVFTLSGNVVSYVVGKNYPVYDLPSSYSQIVNVFNYLLETENPDVFVSYWLYDVNTTWSEYKAYIRKFFFIDGYTKAINEKTIGGISLNDAQSFSNSLNVLTV